MDIQHLIDRLEDLIDEGRHLWFSKLTMIDEERALELIDQMRISIPEEIDKAQRITNQRDRLIAQANEEAARLVELAREKRDALIERDAITQAAKSQAVNIIEAAHQEAESIRADADAYVLDVLRKLEGQLLDNLNVVRNGIEAVAQEREEAQAQARTRAAQKPEPPPEDTSEPEPEAEGSTGSTAPDASAAN
ncbi:MAG: hypothetical protein M5R40_00890 [Anaerolineae bacterium]|nr:hypothetical protein [Anaerolineae bacterium]